MFYYALRTMRSLLNRKKAIAVPVYKAGELKTLKIYQPISLLPIYDKIFERLIYNKMYEFFYSK